MFLVFPYLKEKLKSQKVETHVIVPRIPARIWKCKNISINLKGKEFKTWHLQKVINFKHNNHTLTPHPRWSITPRLRARPFSLSDTFLLLLEDCTATPYVTGAQAHCAAGHRRLAPRSVANHAYINPRDLTLMFTTVGAQDAAAAHVAVRQVAATGFSATTTDTTDNSTDVDYASRELDFSASLFVPICE